MSNIYFSRSKIADFYCFSIDKRQLEKRASMLNARTTHAFHIFDEKILAIGGFDDDGNGMLSIESYDIHCDQWTILTSIPGAVSKTWPQSLGTVGRRIYISVFHTSNSFIVMQEGYFFDLDTQRWEAMYREQTLGQKLAFLQGVLRDAQQTSNESWQAIIHEDRLLARINALEDQIRIYRTKFPNEDTIKQELIQLTDSHIKFEEASKIKLEKAILERADAINRSKSLECSLQLIQDELKRYEELYEQHKQDTEQLVQSIDEQRSLISEFEIKLRDSDKQYTELENDKQRIQTNFDEYYQRTHQLEELQKKSMQNGTSHDQCQEDSSSKDIIIEETTNSVEIPIIIENGEIEKPHQSMIPSNQNDSIINHNHEEEYDNNINGFDSMNELIEAQKQIDLLRKNLNETMERLVSTEDSYRSEQQRCRSLTTEHETIHDELSQLKIRFNKEKNDNNELFQQQQSRLDYLSKSILSKENKHNRLLSVYIWFFLCCYLLIFFLFFFLLSW
ncbi:unnamed protein product [Rotaria sp. Silwood2]|nr:unnamed protein product [Rotaria sp. Silwood2]